MNKIQDNHGYTGSSTDVAVLGTEGHAVIPTEPESPAETKFPDPGEPNSAGSESSTSSRRAMMSGALSAAAAFLWGKSARASCTPTSAAVKLATKATFGYTEGVACEIGNTSKSYANWVDQQLYFQLHTKATDPHYDFLQEWIVNETSLVGTDYPLLDFPNPFSLSSSDYVKELTEARIVRACKSNAQVFERTVEFFTDHLNVYFGAVARPMQVLYDRDVIRKNALGKLKTLLVDSAISPAMLHYLNGRQNSDANVNENYARELLELHTLGVDNCYDQATIEGLAKALTGWMVNSVELQSYTSSFDKDRHLFNALSIDFPCSGTTKTLTIPAGDYATDTESITDTNSGANSVVKIIDFLTDPAQLGRETARYIGGKLAVHFLGYDALNITLPGSVDLLDAIEDAYVAAYNAGSNDIAAMLEVILSEDAMAEATPKLKRPLHVLASACRALDVSMELFRYNGSIASRSGPTELVLKYLTPSGHAPYFWPAPNGYPDTMEHWSGLLLRWDFASRLPAENEWQELKYRRVALGANVITDFNSTATDTVTKALDYLNDRMLGNQMSQDDYDAIFNYVDGLSSFGETEKRIMAGLIIGSPSFQWY
ncbi:MAG: DUF1800 domain-containing protein [Phycisphaerales bacterium]|nr:DUF1800 domain-containing protein [Phycisphaerales bacterium]